MIIRARADTYKLFIYIYYKESDASMGKEETWRERAERCDSNKEKKKSFFIPASQPIWTTCLDVQRDHT
jgi:hypothetical protein